MTLAKGRQRSQKWYLKNEAEVMQELGLKETKGSGNGWIEKEDGQNDFIICQLKSTDKESYRIKQLDLDKLEYNASIANKIPMFVIQFLNNDSRYALVAIDDIPAISKYIKVGEIERPAQVNLEHESNKVKRSKPVIKSDMQAAIKYKKEQEKKWEEKKWKSKLK